MSFEQRKKFIIDILSDIFVDFRSLKGNKGDKWLNGQVTIQSAAYYRLQIEGVIGMNTHF